MPGHWTIDPARQLVEAVLDGEIGEEETVRFLDELEAAGAIPYRKLIDARNVKARADGRIMALVSRRVAAYANPGPFAVIVREAYIDGMAKLFALALGANGRARVFRTEEEARAWLDSAERADPSPRPLSSSSPPLGGEEG
jgi:hypothetical protein